MRSGIWDPHTVIPRVARRVAAAIAGALIVGAPVLAVPSALAIPDPQEGPDSSAMLMVEAGPNAGSEFALDQPVTTVGRDPNSDIVLDDVTVSPRHAEFRLENGEFQVVDVGSVNGTYVNREPVQSAALVNGDELQIGKFRLVFHDRAQRH